MTDIVVDGTIKVSWVPSIASIAAPTTTELNAGLTLENTMAKEGLIGFKADTAPVPTTPLSGTFETSMPGMTSFNNTALRFKKQTSTDTIYATLTRGTSGYVVIRRFLPCGTAWTSGQEVQVYPATCGETALIEPAMNSTEQYEVPTMLSGQPNLRAVVA